MLAEVLFLVLLLDLLRGCSRVYLVLVLPWQCWACDGFCVQHMSDVYTSMVWETISKHKSFHKHFKLENSYHVAH